MKFLKFGSILNIIFGSMLLVVEALAATIGLFLEYNPELLTTFIPEDLKAGYVAFLQDFENYSVSTLVKFLENHGISNSVVVDFLNTTDPTTILIGVGFSLVGYSIIVHLVLTTILLSKVRKANNGITKEPRLFAFFVGVLSLVPFVFTGLFIILGLFGSSNKRPALQNNNRRIQY